jgi:retron-type reverse transcriptase
LELAFYKAQRGKTFKNDVIKFRENLSSNLYMLRRELLDGTFSFGQYNRFTVFEPKKREIYVVPFHERVLHHALINVCNERFEKFQIDQSYACRIGKGVDKAIFKAQEYTKKFKWYLKLDICKYFDSVNHVVIIKTLERLIKDEKVLELFRKIITSYQTSKGCGIPIGNLTSQYIGNVYLSILDHYIKEEIKAKGYVRYMDDFLVFAQSKQQIKEYLFNIECFLKEKLKLTLHQPIINKCEKGISFLGYRVLPDKFRLSQKSKKRFRKKFKVANELLEKGIWSQSEYVRHVETLFAFVQRADTIGFRKKILEC